MLNHRDNMTHEEKDLAATTDHKLPKALGGRNEHDNYVICCYRDNQLKANIPFNVFKTFADMVLVPYSHLPLPILRSSLNLYIMHLLDMSCNNEKIMRQASTISLLKLKDDIDDFEGKKLKRKGKQNVR